MAFGLECSEVVVYVGGYYFFCPYIFSAVFYPEYGVHGVRNTDYAQQLLMPAFEKHRCIKGLVFKMGEWMALVYYLGRQYRSYIHMIIVLNILFLTLGKFGIFHISNAIVGKLMAQGAVYLVPEFYEGFYFLKYVIELFGRGFAAFVIDLIWCHKGQIK